MKKIYLAVYFAVVTTMCFAQSHDVSGTWLGTLDVGVKIRIVFNVKSDGPGMYSATLDSPDQGSKNIPVTSVTMAGDSLHFVLQLLQGGFDGVFLNDTTVSGTWRQLSAKAPLTIVKTKKIFALNRPQTPKPPFSYASEDVEYSNKEKSVRFGATLTYPSTGGPFPTAILLTGSGPQDRDETLFEHRPFAVIADYLTRKGYAVLRIDDRGVGKTTGEVMTATSADFAKDVEAAIEYLKGRPQTDHKRLGLIGHSEGGLIAALVASKRKDIHFMVLLAGPGMKGYELLTEQGEALLKSGGIAASTVEIYKPFYRQMLMLAATENDSAVAFKKTFAEFESWKKLIPQSERNKLGFTNDLVAAKKIRSTIEAASQPWYKYFLNSDASRLLEMTNAKVLALNGEKDLQVIAESNLKGIIVALQKSKSKVHEAKILPGLNHLFQKCTRCTLDEYAGLEETISTDALQVLGDWLDKNVKE